MQNIKIKIDKIKGKSRCFSGRTGNTVGKTTRFITIQTKMPYKMPDNNVCFFRKLKYG